MSTLCILEHFVLAFALLMFRHVLSNLFVGAVYFFSSYNYLETNEKLLVEKIPKKLEHMR
jgi:hypothetical protein